MTFGSCMANLMIKYELVPISINPVLFATRTIETQCFLKLTLLPFRRVGFYYVINTT